MEVSDQRKIDDFELTPEERETLANIRRNYQRQVDRVQDSYNRSLLVINEDWQESETRLANKVMKRQIREAYEAAMPRAESDGDQ